MGDSDIAMVDDANEANCRHALHGYDGRGIHEKEAYHQDNQDDPDDVVDHDVSCEDFDNKRWWVAITGSRARVVSTAEGREFHDEHDCHCHDRHQRDDEPCFSCASALLN